MKVFLVAGKAGSGKNEVANIIKKYLPDTVITSLSKYIKLFALELTDWDGRDFNKPRAFLQNMGDILREIDEDFLVRRMKEDFFVYNKLAIENVVIDLRLRHEIEYFKQIEDLEVITIYVSSSSNVRDLSDEEKNHHTEVDLDNYEGFDYVIDNKFDDTLEKDVIKILEGMK
ncbi:MAG: hypothetical protein K2H20_01395 [Bacilli bacterium]|nr:hypothetical protein [Bacilli bacterium]